MSSSPAGVGAPNKEVRAGVCPRARQRQIRDESGVLGTVVVRPRSWGTFIRMNLG